MLNRIIDKLTKKKWSEAERVLEEMLGMAIELYESPDPELATVYNNVGMFWQERARVATDPAQVASFSERAETMLRESLAMREEVDGPDSTRVSVVRNNLGMLLLQQKRPADALVEFEAAVAIDGYGPFDVAINDEATAIERLSGRHLMSGFHGMFSLGGMVGAAAWSALAPAGVTPTQHLLGATAVLGALALAATPFMLRQHRSAPAGGAGLSLPRGPLLLLGVMAGLGLVGEGAMYDWSVLYLRQELGAPTSIASMGYASFSGAMAAGRFGGDWVRARVRPAPLLRASGVLAALGMVLALAVPHPMGSPRFQCNK